MNCLNLFISEISLSSCFQRMTIYGGKRCQKLLGIWGASTNKKICPKKVAKHENYAQNILYVFPWISVMAEGKHFFV